MKLLVRYRKAAEVRFVSHRDTERMWRRTLRRAALPLVLTQGFAPREKIEMGYPLPVGITGEGEDIIVELSHPVPPEEAAARIGACLPAGFTLVETAAYLSSESLFHRTSRLVYRVAGHGEFTLGVENGSGENIWAFLVRTLDLTPDLARQLTVSRVEVGYRDR